MFSTKPLVITQTNSTTTKSLAMATLPEVTFPRILSITQTGTTSLTLTHPSSTEPLYHFNAIKSPISPETTCHYTLTNHFLPDSPPTQTVLATALATRTNPFYPSLVLISLYPTNHPKPIPFTLRQENTDILSREFTYNIANPLENSLVPTLFKWKSSGCKEVKELGGSGQGMKLVNVKTGEVVAAWSRSRGGFFKHTKGKVGFVKEKGLGKEFEVCVLVSLCALVEVGLAQ